MHDEMFNLVGQVFRYLIYRGFPRACAYSPSLPLRILPTRLLPPILYPRLSYSSRLRL